MSDALSVGGVFVVGLASALIGTMVGGGSLLSIPFLIFLGLPPHVAIATDRFAGIGGAATSLYRYSISKKVVWRLVPMLSLASLAGALIGAQLLVQTDTESLRRVVGGLLIALLPILFLSRDLGIATREVSRPRYAIGVALYFSVQVLAGFFHGGTGTLIFFILMAFFGVTIVEVAATQMIPFLALALSSSILFAANDLIDFRTGFVLMAGTAVGGYAGAHLAVRKGERWVRWLFAIVVLGSAALLITQ